MIPIWTQRDAPHHVRKLLRKAFDDGERIRADLPPGWTPAKGPYMTVVSDGTPTSEAGYTVEIVRVTVYAHDGPSARKLMAAADAALISPAPWRGFRLKPSTGLIVTKNSRVGGWVASTTYKVVMNRKAIPYGSEFAKS